MKLNKAIYPNSLTMLNGLMGIVAIIMLVEERYGTMLAAIFIALLADLLDGLVARRLKVSSPMGKDLDSLSDAISFGAFPAVLAFKMLQFSSGYGDEVIYGLPGLCLGAASIYRLARFNHGDEGTGPFRGLATPAMAMGVLGLFYVVVHEQTFLSTVLSNYFVVLAFIGLTGLLTVSSMPMISNKLTRGHWKNQWPLGLIALCILIPILIWGIAGLVWFIPLYTLISWIYFRWWHPMRE